MPEPVQKPELELDSSLALAVAIKRAEWPHTMDAQKWACEWMKQITKTPCIATDEGAMLGWFANAIMAGHDAAQLAARVDKDDDQRIEVFLDGDQWCALRGANPQEGSACFGNTPLEALRGWLELYGPDGTALK